MTIMDDHGMTMDDSGMTMHDHGKTMRLCTTMVLPYTTMALA